MTGFVSAYLESVTRLRNAPFISIFPFTIEFETERISLDCLASLYGKMNWQVRYIITKATADTTVRKHLYSHHRSCVQFGAAMCENREENNSDQLSAEKLDFSNT